MASELQSLLDDLFSGIRGEIIIIICQTLSYGIYLCLVPIAIHAMVINGLQSRARKWLLAITAVILALMTLHWIISVVFTFLSMDSCNDMAKACFGNDSPSDCLLNKMPETCLPVTSWLAMFNNMLFVNFIIADGVIVWRAWALCSDQSRVVLMIPVVLLAINTVAYLMTVMARIIEIIFPNADSINNILDSLINVTMVTHIMLSFLVNIFATSIIARKAWKYRKLLMESGIGIRTPSQAIRIMALLVESGVIYILISVTSVALTILSLRFGLTVVFGLSTVVGIQLVGIYPIVVVILVEKNRSVNSTFCSLGTIIDVRGDRLSQVEPMTFASGPIIASGGQRFSDKATK